MAYGAGYIGYTGASSTAVSVIADIAEGLDVSGFTPEIVVSSMPGLCADISGCMVPVSGTQLADMIIKLDGISDDILATSAVSVAQDGIGVSGLVLDNIKTGTDFLSGINSDTDSIKTNTDNLDTKLDKISTDLGALSGVLNTIVTTSAVDVSGTSLDDIKTGTDFLSGIDSDTDAIKTNTGYVRADLGNLSGVEASGFAVANATLITMDGVLDDILSDTALIVEDNDDIRIATEATLVVNTSGHGYANVRLNDIATDTGNIDTVLGAIKVDTGYNRDDLGEVSGIYVSGVGLSNSNLQTIGGLINTGNGVLATIDIDTNVIQGDTTTIKGHTGKLASIETSLAALDNSVNSEFPTLLNVGVSSWNPAIVPSFVMYGTGGGGDLIPISSDGDGNLTMSTSGSTPIEITSPVLPADSEFLSTATFTLDANGDIPASNVAVIAAQGASTRILIYGMTISSTGTSGRGYWYLTDGSFVNDGSPYNKASGAIDAAQGIAVTNLAFPYPIAIRANSAVNISVTEAVTQAYLVGTVYYKVADYN